MQREGFTDARVPRDLANRPGCRGGRDEGSPPHRDTLLIADPAASALHYFLLGRIRGVLGHHEATVACAQRALAEATRCGDDVTAGKALFLLSQEAYWTGALRAGTEHGRAAVARLERTDERWWLGLAHWVVAVHLTLLGELGSARAAAAHVLATGEALADPHLECARDDAREHLGEARAVFTALGLPAWVARADQLACDLGVPSSAPLSDGRSPRPSSAPPR